MYSDWSVTAGLVVAVVFVWLALLTFFIRQQNGFLRSLFPKSGERDIRRKFEELLKETSGFREDLEKVKDNLSKVEEGGLRHIQRVEISRYNPYQDSGGDQSFTAALLDKRGNGVVLTSLHARSGTRIFAKPVVGGKASQHELSKEEEMVISKALKK